MTTYTVGKLTGRMLQSLKMSSGAKRTTSTGLLMGVTRGVTTITTCIEGFAVKGSCTDLSIIHDSKRGSCDKPHLPWLLATYVGEERERKKQKRERESQNGDV